MGPTTPTSGLWWRHGGGGSSSGRAVFCMRRTFLSAWEQARYDWILRWDADEFPSDALKNWLKAFRAQLDPPADMSGYTCIWPLWDGKRARTKRWPRRLFMLHRQRARSIGLAHMAPIPDGRTMPLELILHHQPKRMSYGIRNALVRPESRRWQAEIGRALLGKPTDLPCWRWDSPEWPEKMEQIRRNPIWTGVSRLLLSPIWNAREMIECGELPRLSFLTFFPLQHFMACLSYLQARRHQQRQQ